jgi:FkbM family methyltransferase
MIELITQAAKDTLKKGFNALGYRITRLQPANRFDVMSETLRMMRGRGYCPRIVLDCGANLGTWTKMSRRIFPEAEFHLVEPQFGCAETLRKLAEHSPGLSVYSTAVTVPGIASVRMIGGGKAHDCSGAWVATNGESGSDASDYPATTLDQLFADRVREADRCLLKLDLESHEIFALRGAKRILAVVEAIVSEVNIWRTAQGDPQRFSELVSFLNHCGFELYDVASLRGRGMRLWMGDVVFVRRGTPLLQDNFQ